jgi:predicted phage terminase large subunit-like protein
MERRFVQGLWIDFAQTKPFHREWFQFAGRDGNPEIPADGMVAEIGYDPALSKKDTASKTAIVIGGQDTRHGPSYGLGFILHAAQGHWSPSEAVDRLIQLCRAYRVRTVRVEKVAFQEVMKNLIDRAAREAGLSITVQLVAPDADKLIRANAWSPWVQEGRLLFGPGCSELVEALCSVPEDVTGWDLTDAAGYLVRGFRDLAAEKTRIVEVESQTPAFTYATHSGHSALRGSFVNPPPGAPLRARPRQGVPGQRAAGYAVRRPGSVR